MFDVVVVGGNLAGTAAAITAIEKGLKVALIEKNEKPHYPAHCGEGIDTNTASFINFNKIQCYTNPIEEMVIKLANRKKYRIQFRKNGLIVFDRNHLETSLIEKTIKDGVKVYLGKKVNDLQAPNTIITDNNLKIEGKIIIDASGINCVIGRIMGLKPKTLPKDIGVCIQSRVKGNIDKNIMKTWFHKPYAPFGYGWVFPIDNQYANIGIGIPGGQHVNLDRLLSMYIQEEMRGDYSIIDTFRACVPSAAPCKRLVKNNVLLTGDAARLANAFLGSGIANAIVSGCLAGCVSYEYLSNNISTLDLYEDLLSPKINRLNKVYHQRDKVLFKEKFYKKYNRGFFMLSLINKISPYRFSKKVENILNKDIELIRQFKKTSTLL